MTRKWNNAKSNPNYDVGNETSYKAEVLKSNPCDYNDAFILIEHNNSTPVAFKNCAKFTKCITKIHGTITDDTEDLDLVMSITI